MNIADKVKNVGALKPIQALPMKELDEDLEFVLTDSQSQESKEKGHIYVNTGSKRGRLPNGALERNWSSRKWKTTDQSSN